MTAEFPYTTIDLTHTLEETTPSWEGVCGFKSEIMLDYEQCPGAVAFRAQQVHMHAGIGTHIDAPAHTEPGGITVDKIGLENLIRPCVCIDVSAKRQDDYVVSPDDILLFEKKHGRINEKSFVIVYTGWDAYWKEPARYHNNYMFPSISTEAASLLCDRNIAGIGIDTLSPDVPSSGFAVHKQLLGLGKYIVENVANAHLLPPVGAFVLVLPVKAAGLTEAPVRLVGLVNLHAE